MKLAIISTFFRELVNNIAAETPGFGQLSFAETRAKLSSANYCPNAWAKAIEELGHETLVLPYDAPEFQAAWAREQAGAPADPEDQSVEILRQFKPDALIYNCHSGRLLKKIRAEISSLKTVCVLFATPITDRSVFENADFCVSSNPQMVDALKADGLNETYLIHHGYDPAIDAQLQPRPKTGQFLFAGSIVRRKDYHLERDRILELLVGKTPLQLYSRSYRYGAKDEMKTWLKRAAYFGMKPLRAIPGAESLFRKHPLLEEFYDLKAYPRFPVNPKLKPRLHPPLFGAPLFQAMQDALIVLNNHLDSQPYACNMRMFEATGVGTCLLTDRKPNLGELFEDGKEVVSWGSPEECAEKARWLLDHPKEAEAIGKAARARVLKSHLIPMRAAELEQLFRKRV